MVIFNHESSYDNYVFISHLTVNFYWLPSNYNLQANMQVQNCSLQELIPCPFPLPYITTYLFYKAPVYYVLCEFYESKSLGQCRAKLF